MQEPSPRSSRLAIAAILAGVIAFGGGGFLLGRGSVAKPAPRTIVVPAPAPAPTPTPSAPIASVVRRGELIALAGAAADAEASGAPSAASIAAAAGRRFELGIAFGCSGPAAPDSDAPMRWRYDEEAGALRIHVEPMLWQPADWGLDEARFDAVEGFWVPRPWSSSDACRDAPAVLTGTQAVMLPGQTLAIGQLSAPTGSRQSRRDGKPYDAVVRVAPGAVPAERGLRLVLRGRIEAIAGGAPVRCVQPAGREQRPICLVAASFDEIVIQNPVDASALATWTPAGDPRGDR